MSKDDDYKVGYGKPPKQSRFKPGQSGNPKGRPRGNRNLATELEEALSEEVTVREGGREVRTSKQTLMMKQLCNRAAKGDLKSIQAVFALYLKILGVSGEDDGQKILDSDDEALIRDTLKRLAENDHET